MDLLQEIHQMQLALDKQAGVWDDISYHMPNIRLPDTLAGAGVGALGGLGTYGVSSLMDDPEDEADDPSLWKHMLGGAAAGGVAGNVVGDRFRRYVSNNATPWDYNIEEQRKNMQPRSLQHVWDTAIRDKPDTQAMAKMEKEHKPRHEIDIRREFLRRGLGLPVQNPDNAALRSIGDKQFAPDQFSGGVKGTFPAFELNPDYMEPGSGNKMEDIYGWMPEVFADQSQALEGPVGNRYDDRGQPYHPRKNSELNNLLSSHAWRRGVTPEGNNTLRATDLWDFAPYEGEESQFKNFLKNYKKLYKNWGTDMTPEQKKVVGVHAPKEPIGQGEYFKSILTRKLLNDVLLDRGGILFDQAVDIQDPSSPKFHWQGGRKKTGNVATRVTVATPENVGKINDEASLVSTTGSPTSQVAEQGGMSKLRISSQSLGQKIAIALGKQAALKGMAMINNATIPMKGDKKPKGVFKVKHTSMSMTRPVKVQDGKVTCNKKKKKGKQAATASVAHLPSAQTAVATGSSPSDADSPKPSERQTTVQRQAKSQRAYDPIANNMHAMWVPQPTPNRPKPLPKSVAQPSDETAAKLGKLAALKMATILQGANRPTHFNPSLGKKEGTTPATTAMAKKKNVRVSYQSGGGSAH